MEIEINTAENVTRSDAIDQHIHDKLAGLDRHLGDRLTRVRVFLKDVNAHKGGIDKVCTMEARPAGGEPIAVEAQHDDLYKSIRDASGKLERAVEHHFGRRATHH